MKFTAFASTLSMFGMLSVVSAAAIPNPAPAAVDGTGVTLGTYSGNHPYHLLRLALIVSLAIHARGPISAPGIPEVVPIEVLDGVGAR